MMHGEEDTIVPFSMGVEIFEKSNTQKSKYFIKNDDHMMNFDQNLISEIQKFIKRMQFPCFDALTYCQLAEGRLEMVAQCANKIWDIHPIMPIVRAAGAIVTTWGNKNPVVGGNIIVSNNKANHKKILKLLKPLAE